ncbi:MAG: hypothetical protein EOQ55_23645 [Mesorhizobium sp.]|uniref:ABC-three component system protein n=1 Tax=Mesorhizobium sp. TaxID=1871066 RepID=UPI000FE5A7EF|nr:ABC-three component system protein [Mesorhizobium sp.]RWG14586.1 MAG: hypothetical protein EOQ55_23645 [Mesorhizobium sp.]
MLTPFDVIDGASVPARPGLYVLGCYDSRITFYSQQIRALSLAYALFEQGHLPANARIAVVGAGAGGITLAAALAATGGFRIYLFERSDDLMPLQRGATRRRIDPHIYDWPKEDARHEYAELPLLDWRSGSATQVRDDVMREFAAVRAAVGARLEVLLRHDVRSVTPAGADYEIAFEREPNAAELAQGLDRGNGHMRVDIVIFAFGFGIEPPRPIPNTNTESYWSDAGVPGPEITGKARPRFFVSGNGDGGLIDLVAAASADFSHASTIQAIIGQPGIEELTERLRTIDAQAREADAAGAPFDFVAAYDAEIAADVARLGLVDEMVRRLRPGVQLTFQTRDPSLMSVKTATLNRLAVYLVIKACAQNGIAQFHHVVCGTVDSVEPPAGHGRPDYLLECAGNQIPADKVIVRRGPDRQSVRHPFTNVLDGFEAHHAAWLARLAAETLVPTLSDAARAHFQRLSTEHALPMPRYMEAEMAQHVPIRIQLQRNGAQVRWTGDVAPAAAATIWSTQAREAHIISLATPPELGALAHAIARLAIHADRALLVANVPAWRAFLIRLSIESNHAEDLRLPTLRALGADGAILNPVLMPVDAASTELNDAMDQWVLAAIDVHLQAYFATGADPGRKIQFRTEAALRASMRDIWAEWRASFNGAPALLARFLRLILCALDDDDSEDEARVLVGPLKLKGLIRATTVALAVASGWRAMTPHGTRPGNLSRAFADQIHTGHACAADMINGESMALSAAKFMWRTNFVVLPMVHKPTEFSALSDTSLAKIEDGIPRLTEVDDRLNVVLTVDDAFVGAVGAGADALTALLMQAQEFHFSRMNKAIERAVIA